MIIQNIQLILFESREIKKKNVRVINYNFKCINFVEQTLDLHVCIVYPEV